jgi:soluble lytic murein transglycosylase-like protein
MQHPSTKGVCHGLVKFLPACGSVRLSLCLGAILLIAVETAHAADPGEKRLRVDAYSDKYDDYFRHYTQRYFGPFIDWRWFKAQAVAESLLNPQIQSSAGAVGVMQLMPSTFAKIRFDNPNWSDIHSPRWNIAAGIYYGHTLYQQWNGVLHGQDRFLLMLASYNTGVQRVRYAIGMNAQARSYKDIRQGLPLETQAYVDRIRYLMQPAPMEVIPLAVANEAQSLGVNTLQ